MEFMFDIIPLIIILISLATIIAIVVRKFPILAALDLDTIQSEKEAQFKERILSKRLKRNVIRYSSKLANAVKPVWGWLGTIAKKAYHRLLEFKENYNRHNEPLLLVSGLENALREAEDLVAKEEYDEAEKRYIAVISADSQNTDAFEGLGHLYAARKQYAEARQTFEHVLRLLERDDIASGRQDRRNDNPYISSINYELALVARDGGDTRQAAVYIKRATDLMANNPRYLDMKTEIAIMNNDKSTALDSLGRLRDVNPENGKIREFEERIRSL